RSDALVSRRRASADPALPRHADQHRQQVPVRRRMVDRDLSRPYACRTGARRQSARRLAARRAQSEAAMTKALLSVRNLRVEFPTRRGTLVAVDDVSFDIIPGEVLGGVGESGAGKSLTGAAIIGLIEAPGRSGAGVIRLQEQT